MTKARAPEPYDDLDEHMRDIGDIDQRYRPRGSRLRPAFGQPICVFCQLPYDRLREIENCGVMSRGLLLVAHEKCLTASLGDCYKGVHTLLMRAKCTRCSEQYLDHTLVAGEAEPDWNGAFCADGRRFEQQSHLTSSQPFEGAA